MQRPFGAEKLTDTAPKGPGQISPGQRPGVERTPWGKWSSPEPPPGPAEWPLGREFQPLEGKHVENLREVSGRRCPLQVVHVDWQHAIVRQGPPAAGAPVAFAVAPDHGPETLITKLDHQERRRALAGDLELAGRDLVEPSPDDVVILVRLDGPLVDRELAPGRVVPGFACVRS